MRGSWCNARFSMKQHLPKVALLIESSRSYGREVLQGIASYTREHDAWAFYTQERELHSGIPDWLAGWRGDGIIARIENASVAGKLLRLGCPVVDVLGNQSFRGIPGFDTDAQQVARLAADFFLQSGFQHFAFCGFKALPFSDRRGAAFAEYLQARNISVQTFEAPTAHYQPTHIQAVERRGVSDEAAVARWLKRLPRPLALFACNDICAQQVLNACREHQIRVPEEVAVMGVDNDDVLCNLSDPPLTSIEPDARQLGYHAAAALHQMMRGRPVAGHRTDLPPVRVVERASTDIVAVADATLVEALRFIRDHFDSGIAVKDVLAHVKCSRTSLERRFRESLKCNVRDEIQRRRMNRACDLLRETGLGLEEIVARAGYSTPSHFCRIFQKQFKESPTQYRSRVWLETRGNAV